MYRVSALILTLGMLIVLTKPESLKAQKAGAGIVYGDKLNMIGGQVDATYRFHRLFRVAGNVSVFLGKDFENSNDTWNWWSINMNGNIVFLERGRFRSYLLTGLNYATIQVQSPLTGATDVDSDIGLNAGGGIEYSMDFGDLYGETKHIFIDERYKQISVRFGIRFFLRSK